MGDENGHREFEDGGLVWGVASRLATDEMAPEDLVPAGWMGLQRAREACPDGEFAPYATACIENAIRRRLREEQSPDRWVPYQDRVSGSGNGHEPTDSDYAPFVLSLIGELDERGRIVVTLLDLADCTQERVADLLGVNQSTVARWRRRALDQLRETVRGD